MYYVEADGEWLPRSRTSRAGLSGDLLATDLSQMGAMMAIRKRYLSLLTSCAFVGGAVMLSGTSAFAGCNSGNVPNTDLLTSANCQAAATGADSLAVGRDAIAAGNQSTAIGRFADANANFSTALGFAAGPGPGIGTGAVGYTAIGANTNNIATIGAWSIALGAGNNPNQAALSTGLRSIAIGSGNSAANLGAHAFTQDSIAMGTNSQALNGANNIAIGTNSQASNGSENLAIGAGAIANANNGAGLGRATAVGQSIASGLEASAFGFGNTAQGDFSTALGAGNTSTGLRATSVGALNNAIGIHSTAMGVGSTALGNESVAIGSVANALGDRSMALGSNSTANAANSVALGQGSIASRANTVSVGSPGAERQITNVAPGTQGTDAVNLNQLQGVAFGLQTQIDNNRTEARRGIAAALAANGVTTPIRPGGTTVGVAGGFFQSESAVGVNVAHRLYRFPGVVLFGSYANGGSNTNAGKVGASYEF
jgi:hypothetical protein